MQPLSAHAAPADFPATTKPIDELRLLTDAEIQEVLSDVATGEGCCVPDEKFYRDGKYRKLDLAYFDGQYTIGSHMVCISSGGARGICRQLFTDKAGSVYVANPPTQFTKSTDLAIYLKIQPLNALKNHDEAIVAGDAYAKFFIEGYGDPPFSKEELAEAVAAITTVAANGSPDANFYLSEIFGSAELTSAAGLKVDQEKAANAALLAAMKGHPQGMLEIALRYEHGRGVPLSSSEAIFWYEKVHSLPMASFSHLRYTADCKIPFLVDGSVDRRQCEDWAIQR